MDISATSVLVVAFLYFLALSALLDRQRTARWIHGWYHSIPEGKWGPRWFRWQFRPSMKQAHIMTWITILVCVIVGTVFLLSAFT